MFKYVTDNTGELTTDFGFSSANLINNFDDMPHKIRKKAFFLNLNKSNKNSQYDAKFDIDLFKLIRDNFSNGYTLAIEIYFKKQVFLFMQMNFYQQQLHMKL